MDGFVRVNKDDIRAALSTAGWVWSKQNEKDVTTERDRRIVEALSKGLNVVNDDTNLAKKHEDRLRYIANCYGADFEVMTFLTSIKECVVRDSKRAGTEKVGEEVIRNMASTYHFPPDSSYTFAPVTHGEGDDLLMDALICDLDGTLSLFEAKGHRGPYDASHCDEDDCNPHIKRLIEVYYRFLHYQIIYLSGREEKYRAPTEVFLRTHGCPPGPLYMRPSGDSRRDWIVKGELFDANIRGKYRVDFVLDDRNQVVQFWRSIGLTCLQVAAGDF